MSGYTTIGIKDIKRAFQLFDNFQDKVIIKEGRVVAEQHVALRLEPFMFILVLKGTITIKVDYCPYTLCANNFLTIMPSHIIQVIGTSQDFDSKMLMVIPEFIHLPDSISPSITQFMQLRKHPIMELTSEETRQIVNQIATIKEKIQLRTHNLQSVVIMLSLISFLVEIVNLRQIKSKKPVAIHQTRQDEILNDFLGLLLNNCKERHEVSFYANKLCITPQYLSVVLKESTGKTANQLIDEARVVEAKLFLRSQEYTIQQVADILRFADQSVFGKFFKKHTGSTPSEYKKKYLYA